MHAVAEGSDNSQELSKDMSRRSVKPQSPPSRGYPYPEPAQNKRDGGANSCDGGFDQNNISAAARTLLRTLEMGGTSARWL
jgi:hypothetical protein